MKKISAKIADFLHSQSFVVISSLDKDGFPHTSCKDIVKIDPEGRVYLVDVYHGVTAENIGRNPKASISAVDEHKFIGYCLKGKAKFMPEDISLEIIKTWEDKITSRLAKRLLKNLAGAKGHEHHPEASLPSPKHIILIEVEEIVDLAPFNLTK
ncbi:MAG: pyridoxamine 5'-phosphate oxidase family protein [Candidatus Omnitrophota bacterium]|nr:pyridoxamine 5'-phosphate oxidase family protein [Candidatus Omnitrophota bacterium]